MLIVHFKVEKLIHGFVETVATGNGVLLYGLSDYGSTIGYGDGGSGSSDGGVDSLGGGSKPVRIRRPVIKIKHCRLQQLQPQILYFKF